MASMVRYEPFNLWGTRPGFESFDRLFDRLFEDSIERNQPAQRGVGANLYQTADAYWVELPLPGVKPDDVEVTVQETLLTIAAKRSWQMPEKAQAIWQGFGPGEWKQSFTLPGEVNPDGVEASMEYGVLRLSLPKAEHVRPRTIRVNGIAGNQPQAIEASVKDTTPKDTTAKTKSK
jgi:HSP20 family protein